MTKKDYELSVRVDGNKLPEYGSHGKTYVRGEKNRVFTLYFKNNTADRVLARISVDGLSVLDGKAASKDKSGYICNAYSSIEIDGWRTSLDAVRKFEFSSKGKSYAGKTEGTTNCGVIGVQVFSEKEEKVKVIEKHIHHHHDHDNDIWPPNPYPWPKWPHPHRPWLKRHGDDFTCQTKSSMGDMRKSSFMGSSDTSMLRSRGFDDEASYSACISGNNASSEVTDYNLGTKYGDAKNSSVNLVNFEVGKFLVQLDLYYTDRDGLEKAGIDVEKKPAVSVHPKAFSGFCQPPED
jgi:hypothetical protein